MNKNIEKIAQLLREFQKVDSELPLQYAVCLIEISRYEGCSLTDLSNKTGMPLSTISRIVGALSRHRQSGKAYGLISSKPSPTERRKKELHLTAKGRAIIEGLTKIMSTHSHLN